jgi:hypothetical protein
MFYVYLLPTILTVLHRFNLSQPLKEAIFVETIFSTKTFFPDLTHFQVVILTSKIDIFSQETFFAFLFFLALLISVLLSLDLIFLEEKRIAKQK